MQRFIIGRFLQAVISVLLVATAVFIMVRLTGDPIDVLTDPRATVEDRALLAESLGLDKPVIVQYGIYMSHLVQGEFGKSFNYRRQALEVVLERLPATIELGGAAMVLALLIALPIGTYSAVKRGGWFDGLARAFAFTGQAAPAFWVGIMGILVFAVALGWLPAGGRGTPLHLIMPAVTLGWGISAGILRLTRSSMLNVLSSDYIMLARAKGLSPLVVIWKHGFKNAAIPVLTFAILLLVLAIGGAVITETVFAWPGVGRLMMNAVVNRDFPIVQAVVIILSVSYIGLNLIADILYAYLNPRIRYK